MSDIVDLLNLSINKDKITKNNTNKQIAKKLSTKFDCSKEELDILSAMTVKYIDGDMDNLVVDIFDTIYDNKNKSIIYIQNIKYIQNLLSLGWINITLRTMPYEAEIKDLELLQCKIELSYSMIYVLEHGKKEKQAKISGDVYKSEIEYLLDNFILSDSYEQYSFDRNNNFAKNNLKIRYKEMYSKIKEKIKKTKSQSTCKLFIEDTLSKYKINANERIIFMFLLKNEYMPNSNNQNEINTILSLISKNQKEYIVNKALFTSSSRLISNGLISKLENIDFFTSSHLVEIDEDFIEEIESHIYKNNETKDSKDSVEDNIKEDNFFSLVKSKIFLKDVILEDSLKDTISKIIKRNNPKVIAKMKLWKISDDDNFSTKIIFHGPSGTGKTLCAKAIANELDKKLITLDCSKILDMYHGESEKNTKKIFDKINEIEEELGYKPILLLDEADQFLSTRSKYSVNSSNNIQNIFLQQIEQYDGILIATTNFIELIDKAFSRRFDYKLVFKKPNQKDRFEIWKNKLPKIKLNIDIKKLSTYELSGGEIDVIIKNTAFEVALQDKPKFTTNDFIHFINIELDSKLEKKVIGYN